MEIREIYSGIEGQLMEIEPLLKKQEAKVSECEAMLEKAMAAMEAAENELKTTKSRYEALTRAKEALGDMADIPPKKLKEEVEEEEKIDDFLSTMKIVKKPIKQPVWKHKDAVLVRFDRHGKEIDRYRNQSAAARNMGWSQSGLSHFMKFDKEGQIRRKGFYFQWEH